MKLENTKLMLYPLEITDLENFLEGIFEMEGIVFNGFDLDSIQKRAIGIKIKKMKQQQLNRHNWYTYWLIVDSLTDNAIGTIGFKGLEPDKSAEVGYKIVKSYEGKGYMSSALKLLLTWAYDQKICQTITASKVLVSNIGSQRVLEKMEFKKVRIGKKDIDYCLRRSV